MSDQTVLVPEFCYKHLHKVVHESKLGPNDPWRALVVVANIAMFQGATSTQGVWNRLQGDVTKISELGCLACFLPAKFESIVRLARKRDLTGIKKLGEKWVSEASIKTEGQDNG